MMSLPNAVSSIQSIQWNPLNEVYLLPNFDVSSFFVTEDT